jgi:hypothetical protein
MTCGRHVPTVHLPGAETHPHPLFKVLEPAATMVPLISLAIQDRYEGPAPHLPYIVGVDARFVFCLLCSPPMSKIQFSLLNSSAWFE